MSLRLAFPFLLRTGQRIVAEGGRASSASNEPRILAIAHLHFDETADDVVATLQRLPTTTRVVVTCTPEFTLADYVQRRLPEANVQRVANLGRDIRPFLEVLRTVDLDVFDVVVKLHGKRSLHLRRGDAWRKKLLAQLVPSATGATLVARAFGSHPHLGVLAPRAALLNRAWSRRNVATMRRLATQVGISDLPRDYFFPAGTMFWASPAALRWCNNVDLGELTMSATGSLDGEVEHALERLFGAIPLAQGRAVLPQELFAPSN